MRPVESWDHGGVVPLRAALVDLAEFGWIDTDDPDIAKAVQQAATEAGYPAVLRETGRGWWRVEIPDMRPKPREGGKPGDGPVDDAPAPA